MTGSVSSTSAMRLAGDGSPRQDDEHHRHHQEGEHDLHGILHEGHHVAHLHGGLRPPGARRPR